MNELSSSISLFVIECVEVLMILSKQASRAKESRFEEIICIFLC